VFICGFIRPWAFEIEIEGEIEIGKMTRDA